MGLIARYLWNILISVDQLANTVLGGDPDMSLSGRMGRAIKEGRCILCRPICWILGKLDKDHCKKQDIKEADEGRDAVFK